MSILSPILKETFERQVKTLGVVSGAKMISNRVVAKVIENQRSEATVRGFTLVQDEPATVAGTGQGPTPTDYFVTSVAFCENVIFARTAAMHDVNVEALETTVTGEWDQKGLFEIDGASSEFRRIVVETRIKTQSPVAQLVEVAHLTHRRCPVHQTLKRATALTFKLFVNDSEVTL